MPDVPVIVKITYDANSLKVTFSFTKAADASGNGEKMLSTGSITMNSEETQNA